MRWTLISDSCYSSQSFVCDPSLKAQGLWISPQVLEYVGGELDLGLPSVMLQGVHKQRASSLSKVTNE